MFAGIFAGAGYYVESNREHGTGRTNLVIRDRSCRRVMIIETKHVDKESQLETVCKEAAKQIDSRRYAAEFTKGYRQSSAMESHFIIRNVWSENLKK